MLTEYVQISPLLTEALGLIRELEGPPFNHLRDSIDRALYSRWTVLVSGLCSVGKSSFVGALWGDSTMLPTAVRDCTQTNTLIRVPGNGESDPRILLSYLPRPTALEFALRDISYYRLSELLAEQSGPFGPRLDDMLPEQRLRAAVSFVRKLFEEKPSIFVLHEPLTEELEKLEQFLEFIDSPDYRPDETIEARWEDRRLHLMGHRRPDGRTLDVGKLLSLRHIEIVRNSELWRHEESATPPPRVIDTPWIPIFHNARRAELILSQAREVDVLVILALPQKFELEPWTTHIFRERPELLKRTLIVFNQIDTVDTSALFSREGFATVFQENAERLARVGIPAENLFMTCARLPFLERAPKDGLNETFISKLRSVLQRLNRLADSRAESDFKRKLLRASDASDCGMETLRAKLLNLAAGPVLKANSIAALKTLQSIPAVDLPVAHQEDWKKLLRLAAQ